MIKKLFHYLCVLVFGALGLALLVALYWLFFDTFYSINILDFNTYVLMSQFWDSGGVLKAGDVIMMLILLSIFPLLLIYLYWLNKCKFINLIVTPLQWINEHTLKNYKQASINIKNLKIEDKKTIEQLVEERIEEENKNRQQNAQMKDFRKTVINKINSEKKEKNS